MEPATIETPRSGGTGGARPLVEMRRIRKRFLEVRAADGVDLVINRNEILGLLGENGAGKTTLMRILFGLLRPDSGEILVEGNPVSFRSPLDAISRGIGMVHQHFNLVDNHTVLENIVIGDSSSCRRGLVDYAGSRSRILALSRRYGLEVDPDARVRQLAVGQKQRVEIVKALYRRVKLLILDEPTAVLTPQEVEALFGTLRRLVEDELSIVFISHKLKEVMAVTDRSVILRRGRRVGEAVTAETTREKLAALMVGSRESFSPKKKVFAPSGTLLRIDSVRVNNDLGVEAVRGVSLEVGRGEILGIAGVSGNGQRELAEALAGVRRIEAGSVELAGEPIANLSPARLVRAGLARIPEDRFRLGLVMDFSIAENLVMERLHEPQFCRGIFLRWRPIGALARRLMEAFDIRASSARVPARSLSGGNIQKVLLARELSLEPRLILAAQPTRGLDIGAAAYVRRLLEKEREKGKGVILISEDLDELLAVCDTIAVMYEGEVMKKLSAPEAARERLGRLMMGVREESPAPAGP